MCNTHFPTVYQLTNISLFKKSCDCKGTELMYKTNRTTVFTQFVTHLWIIVQCVTIWVQIILFSSLRLIVTLSNMYVAPHKQIWQEEVIWQIIAFKMCPTIYSVIIMSIVKICDQARENRAYGHILIFEKYQFELFNGT